MKQSLIIVFSLFLLNGLLAQSTNVEAYTWEDNSEVIGSNDLETAVIGLKTEFIDEFAIGSSGNLSHFVLRRKMIQLNTDEAIEQFNKIYIPISAGGRLIESNARVINPDRSVVVQKEEDIITAKDEETGREYRYFAMEGIQKGAIVDYFYSLEKYPDLNGNRLNIQDDYDQEKVSYMLIHPSFLVFKHKSYNGLPDLELIEEEEDYTYLGFDEKNIPLLKEEDSANYAANLQYLIYKLDQNPSRGIYDISNYSRIIENKQEYFYSTPKKANLKLIKKMVNELDMVNMFDLKERIRLVEDFLKENYTYVESSEAELSDLSVVLDKKVANLNGMTKLYVSFFNYLGLKHQLVITSNRFRNKFDPEFEAYNFLDSYLIYFPEIDMYLCPSELDSRLGYPPLKYVNNYGLFFKTIKMGGVESTVGKIKYIESNTMEDNFSNIAVKIRFDEEDMTNLFLDLKNEDFGYRCFFQTYLPLLDEEARQEISENYIKFFDPDLEAENIEVKNDNAAAFGIQPFSVTCNTESSNFVDKAGNKYLVKVGQFIGPQRELYQEEAERTQEVELRFRTKYKRTIELTVPEGYVIKNLDDLNIKSEFINDGESEMLFHSYYEKKDNLIIINADEYYKVVSVEKQDYENYREVVNSAADFNKIVLIMEKAE